MTINVIAMLVVLVFCGVAIWALVTYARDPMRSIGILLVVIIGLFALIGGYTGGFGVVRIG